MSYRCPKNGRFVSEMVCSKCIDPPEPAYDVCIEYNTLSQTKIKEEGN